jgi:hypothetical protein
MVVHITLARTGWYHRYEAYLLVWGTLTVFVAARSWHATGGRLLPQGRPRSTSALGLAAAGVLVVLALGLRIQAWQTAPEACLDIAAQHAQMARFVDRYYDDARIVLNDVGYVSYLSEGPILDLGGLASHSVAQARAGGEFDAEWVEGAAKDHGAEIAINYALEVIPESWDRVATWDTKGARVAVPGIVHFYALEPGAREELLKNLREFEDSLHPRVHVRYYERSGG